MVPVQLATRAFDDHPHPLLVFHVDGRIAAANREALRTLLPQGADPSTLTLSEIFEASPSQQQLPSPALPLRTDMSTVTTPLCRNDGCAEAGQLKLIVLGGEATGYGLALWTEGANEWATDAFLTEHHSYRSLFEQSHDAVFILDLTGKHVSVNQRAADMLGYTREEIRDLSLADLSADPPQSYGVLERLLAGEVVAPYERVFRRKDGSRVHVEINAEVVRDSRGEPLHVQSMVRDITRRKEDEATIRRLLDEKELLLREIHHRVKNNLSSIISMIQLEAMENGEPAVESAMNTLERRVRSMLLVYDSLFASDEYETVRLHEYLYELAERLRESYSHLPHVVLDTRLTPIDVPAGVAFPVGIVVNELVTNAFKYAFDPAEGGTITVALTREGGQLVLAVADDGAGASTDAPPESGFGTVMIDALVGKFGGSLIRSSDRGTRVEIRVPLASIEAGTHDPERARARNAGTNGAR